MIVTRYVFLFIGLLLCFSNCKTTRGTSFTFSENSVIAHRGAWKANDLPKNSIAALRQAIKLGCVGSEFDVRMTADEILIVTHDADYHGMLIEDTNYSELSKQRLPNGEILPKLRDFIVAALENNDSTGLVFEIKPSKYKERNTTIAKKSVALVQELKAQKHILAYISFSYDILKEIHLLDPQAKTQYLDGSKTPDQLKEDEISGLDYAVDKLKKHPEWISQSKEKGLLLNSWTANNKEDIEWLIDNDFDYITTDEPQLVFTMLQESPTSKGYRLIWSDEFNYEGTPDSTKWAFEYGFIRNQENQYYVDSSKNARAEKGFLVLEAHKEQIENQAFISSDSKSWKQNLHHAEYTAPSLTTKDIAEWIYGRIEIRAKLPKGLGLWPAFWMLGANYDQVKWPGCGEIDIMEHVGFEPDSIFGTIHTKAYNHMKGTAKGMKTFIDNPYDSFHVFALEWTPEKLDFILDDTVYNRIENENKSTDEWPFDQDFHLKINIAVGGMLGGQKGIDNKIFPAQMLIDYVRVFQKGDK